MQNSAVRQWCLWGPVVGLMSLLAGCGGGGGSAQHITAPGGPPSTSSANSVTRFDVNTRTGKVTLSKVDPSGRAVFVGNAVSFTSSDLITSPGDAGTRVLQVSVNNLSGQIFGPNAHLVIGNLTNNTPVNLRSQVAVTTLSGSGSAGGTDGPANIASFRLPNGIVVDLTGTKIYVDDTQSATVRQLGNDGFTSTLAGTVGSAAATDGTGAAARFNQPDQIARDAQGNLFVADLGNNIVRRITPLGEVTTIAGTGTAGNANGAATADMATFNQPQGIAVSADGNRIYISELNDIRLISYGAGARQLPTSYSVTTVAGAAASGYLDSLSGQAPLFNHPYHLALATENTGAETLYVTDLLNNAVRRISSPTSSPVVSTIAGGNGPGNADGTGSAVLFNQPKGITVLPNGSGKNTLFLTESNHQVRMITLQGSEPTQKGSYLVQTLAGNGTPGFADGDGTTARFNNPAGITALPIAGASATLYITDATNNRIRKMVVSSSALSSGTGSGSGTTEAVRLLNPDSEVPNQTAWTKNLDPQNGSPASLQFFVPSGVSSFSFTVYVEADTNLINLPATSANSVATVAGDGQSGLFNGPGKLAEFSQPVGIASSNGTTALGNYRAFVTEIFTRRIRAIDPAGNVTYLAGGGTNPGDGPANQVALTEPFGIATGPDGSVYFTDRAGGKVRRIAMVGSTLTVATIAGSGGTPALDGYGNVISLGQPAGIAVDRGGTIYITDYTAHTVRKITYLNGDPMAASSYYVNTLAGAYSLPGSSDGSGANVRFNQPLGIAVDTDGKLYVCDSANNTVRVLVRSGFNAVNVTTFAGMAGAAGSADGTGAAARFNVTTGIALDTAHNLYVSDFNNNRIRRINPQGTVVTLAGAGAGFSDGMIGTLNGPYMLSLEPSGNLLVADYSNNSVRVVQRVVSDGQASRAAAFSVPRRRSRR